MFEAFMAFTPARKALFALIGFLAVFAIGFTACEVYEHKAPWGLGPQKAALEQKVGKLSGDVANLWSAIDSWKRAYQSLDDRRSAELHRAARAVELSDQAKADQADASFENGYAAGKAVGLRSQGAPHAPNPSSDPAAVAAGGVRDGSDDLSTLVGHGAYRAP